jgi:hypothetical protein
MLRTQNWSHFVRRAAITYLFILVGVLGADLIRIGKVLSPPAMIGYGLLIWGEGATCCVAMSSIYYMLFSP